MKYRSLLPLAVLPGLFFAPFALPAETDPVDPLRELFSPEEADEFRDYLEAHLPPELPGFLVEFREHHPDEAEELVDRLFATMEEYHEIAEFEPERAEQFADYNRLEVRSRLLAYQLEESKDPEERELLEDRIAATVEKAFSVQMDLQRARLHDLEEEVDELADLLCRRAEARSQIIARRIATLTGENEHLQW